MPLVHFGSLNWKRAFFGRLTEFRYFSEIYAEQANEQSKQATRQAALLFESVVEEKSGRGTRTTFSPRVE